MSKFRGKPIPRVLITLEGGVITDVDSEVELDVVILDIDDGGMYDYEYSISRYITEPDKFPKVMDNFYETFNKAMDERDDDAKKDLEKIIRGPLYVP